MSGSLARCQRVGCGALVDDRRRRVRVATTYYSHPTDATDASAFIQWHPTNIAVNVVLCDACASALSATDITRPGVG